MRAPTVAENPPTRQEGEGCLPKQGRHPRAQGGYQGDDQQGEAGHREEEDERGAQERGEQ